MKARGKSTSGSGREHIEVCLDADIVESLQRVGTLFHTRGHGHSVFSFVYDPQWLRRPNTFEIDPDLQLHSAESYPSQPAGVFRIFTDSAPDRWGRLLLDRRETLKAREEKRPARTLTEWDYLLGVHDSCRMGALRFRIDAGSPFLDNDLNLAAPPIASLRELEAASLALEAPDADEKPEFSRWLTALLAPGSSLGGARPKANYTDADGSLWIAKFPSRDDRRDIGAWEMISHELAEAAGVQVPEGRLLSLGRRHRTFASRRFDRVAKGRRRFFVSAMTLLNRQDGDAASYLELAEFISTRGSPAQKGNDLRQLWTRIIFNILTSNRDDHLRNHGFILDVDGWHLAPAYDLNPNLERTHHQLAIDARDPTPDVELALETAEFYGLTTAQARDILLSVKECVRKWRILAKKHGLPRGETEIVAQAFSAAESI
ncbi:MAG: type II toxin-antitoxin system HipA family toxin [Opitutaceae bacterium]|nr:type II toxin-antitoxin system HipA family toxin [Opitutaceae bacterium]